MLLLRNVNFHVDRSSIGLHKTSVVLHADDYEKEQEYYAAVLLNLELEQLLRKRECRQQYIIPEIESAIQWFQEKQVIFGAGHLFKRRVELYCKELLEVYKAALSRCLPIRDASLVAKRVALGASADSAAFVLK